MKSMVQIVYAPPAAAAQSVGSPALALLALSQTAAALT